MIAATVQIVQTVQICPDTERSESNEGSEGGLSYWPVEEEEWEHRWEVGGRGVSREVEDKQNDDAACGGNQVIELWRKDRGLAVAAGADVGCWG